MTSPCSCEGDVTTHTAKLLPFLSKHLSLLCAGFQSSKTIQSYIYMAGRLPAVAGMPANRTFLELSAGQSDWPEKKLRGFVTKKAQETCFVSPRRKAIFLMDSPLSQHKKRSLPSDIRYFPFALVNYSVTSMKLGSQSKSTTLCRKRPVS